jgi:hypothetical protein
MGNNSTGATSTGGASSGTSSNSVPNAKKGLAGAALSPPA